MSQSSHILLYDLEDPSYLPMLEQLRELGFALVLNCGVLAGRARQRGMPVLDWLDFAPDSTHSLAERETARMFDAIARCIERMSLASIFDTMCGNVVVRNGNDFFSRLDHIFAEAIETIATLQAAHAAVELSLVCVASERSHRQRALLRMAKRIGIPTLLIDHFDYLCDEPSGVSRKLLSRHVATYSEAAANYFRDLGAPAANIETVGAPHIGGMFSAENNTGTGLKQRLRLAASDRLILVLGGFFEFNVSGFQRRLSNLYAFNQRLVQLASTAGCHLALVLHPEEVASAARASRSFEELAARYKIWAAARGAGDLRVLESVTAAESVEADLLISFGANPKMMPALVGCRPVLVFDWSGSGLPHMPREVNAMIITEAATLPGAARELLEQPAPPDDVRQAGQSHVENDATRRLVELMARIIGEPAPRPATDSEQTGIGNEILNGIYAMVAENGYFGGE